MARCVTAAAQRGPPLAPGEEAGAVHGAGRGRLQKAAWIAALPAGRALRPPPGDSAPGLPVPRWSLVPSPRTTGINPGSRAQKLPTAAGVRGSAHGAGAARALGALPGPPSLVLPAGTGSSATAALSLPWAPNGRLAPRPPTLAVPSTPRGPFRPGIVGGCSREAQALAGTSQGAVSQLNHRGSFPANKSPAHRGRVPPTPRV